MTPNDIHHLKPRRVGWWKILMVVGLMVVWFKIIPYLGRETVDDWMILGVGWFLFYLSATVIGWIVDVWTLSHHKGEGINQKENEKCL